MSFSRGKYVDTLIRVLCAGNRPIFVLATIAVAIAAGRVSSLPSELQSWVATVAGAILLFCADVGREIESNAQALALNSAKPLNRARVDLWRANSRPSVAVLATVAVFFGLVACGSLLWSSNSAQLPTDLKEQEGDRPTGTTGTLHTQGSELPPSTVDVGTTVTTLMGVDQRVTTSDRSAP